MSDFPYSSKPLAQPDNGTSTIRVGIFRRRFRCGHPDEFIEATRNDNGERIHNLVTYATFEAVRRHYGSLPAYTQARCLDCAKTAKAKDELRPAVRPKKTLGTYQMGFTSMDLEDALTRYRYSAGLGSVQPHPRVSEAEHYAHRIEMLRKAVECAGTWLAVPARRVQNIPVQMKDAAKQAPHRPEPSILDEKEVADGLKETDCCKFESIIEASETTDGLPESPHSSSVGSIDKSSGMATVKCTSSLASRQESHKIMLAAVVTQNYSDLTAANAERARIDCRSEACSVRCASDADSPITSSETHIGRHNAYHESLPDALSYPTLTSPEYEDPRPAPAVPSVPSSPREGALDFIRRRSSTSTWRHSRSASRKMNFRKLGIDVQRTRSFKKTDLDSDSPDWACQTSRAIEAGRISMDSVGSHGRKLTRSKRIPADRCSPTGRRNTYPLPAGDSSPVLPLHARHSEGAPQALRANASRRHGRLVGMEITSSRKGNSKHDSAQGALVFDLNKRLPELPPQAGCEDRED